MKKIILLAVSSALLSSGLLLSTPAISSATVLPSEGTTTIPYSGAPDTSYTSPNGTCIFQITAVGGAGGSGSYNGGVGGDGGLGGYVSAQFSVPANSTFSFNGGGGGYFGGGGGGATGSRNNSLYAGGAGGGGGSSYISASGTAQSVSAPSQVPSANGSVSITVISCWLPTVYSKPTAPSSVSASMSSGTATVSFSPGSSGNLPTYNQIDMYINGVLVGNVCNVAGTSACPIANLGPDVVFTFTVTAVNSKGSAVSALSNPVSYASVSFALPTSTTTTTTTTVPLAKSTISCVKGTVTKKVTAVNPVCPAGYKKK